MTSTAVLESGSVIDADVVVLAVAWTPVELGLGADEVVLVRGWAGESQEGYNIFFFKLYYTRLKKKHNIDV